VQRVTWRVRKNGKNVTLDANGVRRTSKCIMILTESKPIPK
jgi:hypothetical protein